MSLKPQLSNNERPEEKSSSILSFANFYEPSNGQWDSIMYYITSLFQYFPNTKHNYFTVSSREHYICIKNTIGSLGLSYFGLFSLTEYYWISRNQPAYSTSRTEGIHMKKPTMQLIRFIQQLPHTQTELDTYEKPKFSSSSHTN